MNITYFLTHFPVASETFVLNQITSLIDLGYDVKIVSIWKGDFTRLHPDFENYKLRERVKYLLPEENGGVIKKTIKRLYKIIFNLNKKPVRDALNFGEYGNHAKKLLLPYITALNHDSIKSDVFIAHFGTTGVLANKLRQVNFLQGSVCTVFHGIDMSLYEVIRNYEADYKKLFEQTELMLPISYLWKKRLLEMGCPSTKIEVLRMGVDVENFTYNQREQVQLPIKIISVARLTEKKGIDDAINACALLKQQGVPFSYTILGDGPLKEELKKIIEDNNLQQYVDLAGFKNQDEVKTLLSQSDVFLLPSVTGKNGDMEGIPVALMEAMARGLPVVSTFHSGIPELIENEVSGWLVAEHDPVSLAAVLKKLALNEVQLGAVLAKAREKIEIDFNEKLINQSLAHKLESKFRE